MRRREAYVALEAARKVEQTEEFKTEYARRAGVEGVHAKAGADDGLAAFALHRRTSHSSSACRKRNGHECVSVA